MNLYYHAQSLSHHSWPLGHQGLPIYFTAAAPSTHLPFPLLSLLLPWISATSYSWSLTVQVKPQESGFKNYCECEGIIPQTIWPCILTVKHFWENIYIIFLRSDTFKLLFDNNMSRHNVTDQSFTGSMLNPMCAQIAEIYFPFLVYIQNCIYWDIHQFFLVY